MRENFQTQTLQAWLDTPAGAFFVAQHGSRQAAANAIVDADDADRVWRREQAVRRTAVQRNRWPSIDDAVNDTPDPLGGGGASLSGELGDIVKAVRRLDPTRRLTVVPESAPAETVVYDQDMTTGKVTRADTRAPWAR